MDIETAERTTLKEYQEYNLAYAIERQEQERLASYQAWASQMVQAQKNVGSKKKPEMKPVFETFDDFYNEKQAFKAIFEPEQVQEQIEEEKPLSLADKNRMLNKSRKEEFNG